MTLSRERVAVVVATHNRPALLHECLLALAGQGRQPEEVVIVDDASEPPAAAVCNEFSAVLPLRLVRREVAGGPGRARNAGWPLTTTDHVAFTDDDCRPTSGWLQALCDCAARDRVVVGRVLPDPRDGPMISVLDRSMRVDADDGRFSTCNVMYPRALLDRLRGFDDSFDMPYGEDTDLGQRALESGASSCFAPDALVFHAVHRHGIRAAIRERWRVREMARLFRRHPRLRYSEHHDGLWLTRDHRLAAQVLAGVAAMSFTPSGAVAARRWLDVAVGERADQWPQSPAWRTLPLLLLLDAVEMAACIDGSIRQRTLLL